MWGTTFIPLKLHRVGGSMAFQPVQGILNFTLTYYRIKYPSQLYVIEKSDKHSSYVYFDAINKNIE